MFEKEYDLLVIEGKATQAEKLEAWEKIYVEYANMLMEGSGNELYQKTIDINYISTKIFIVERIRVHLSASYNADLLGVLKFYGVANGITEKDTCEQRCKKLDMVVKKIRRWTTDLDLLRKDFDALKEEQTDKNGGREFFEDSLTNISTYRKYSVLDKDITVRQFVKALKHIEREYMRLATKNM